MKLHAVDDGWSRKVPPALRPSPLTGTQLALLTELAKWNVTLAEAQRELAVGLADRDFELSMRAARRLLAVGAVMGDIATRMERAL